MSALFTPSPIYILSVCFRVAGYGGAHSFFYLLISNSALSHTHIKKKRALVFHINTWVTSFLENRNWNFWVSFCPISRSLSASPSLFSVSQAFVRLQETLHWQFHFCISPQTTCRCSQRVYLFLAVIIGPWIYRGGSGGYEVVGLHLDCFVLL